MKMFCQSLFAKLTLAEATTVLVDESRKSTEYPEAGAAERSPKLFPSTINRLLTVPLPERPPFTSERVGAAIVKALGRFADPPPGLVTVILKIVPAALRFAETEGTATSRLVAEYAVTAADTAAPPAAGVKVTVGLTAVFPDPD